MRKVLLPIIVICLFMACVSTPPLPPLVDDDKNPGTNPELVVKIPDLFSPDPEIVDDTMKVSIQVKHPAPIRDWDIVIQAQRQRLTPEQLAQIQERREARQGTSQQRERRPFFEQSGTGTPPAEWIWNGRSTSRVSHGVGEMVQSATAYQFALYVNDIYGNHSTYEGTIEVDVIVRKDGNKLRIVVPAITFEGSSSNFSQVVENRLSEAEVNSNRRVLRLIASALGKYPDYKITIEGHANPLHAPNTTAGRNEVSTLRSLSEQRARAVGKYLSENHEIAASRFNYIGVGADHVVVAFNEDDEEKWKNRRVEFILVR